MMQSQWPGLGPNVDLASLDLAGGEGGKLWPGQPPFATPLPAQPPDAVARPWWSCGSGTANGTDPYGGLFGGANGANGNLFGLVSGLVNALQQLVGALLNQATTPAAGPNANGGANANGATATPGPVWDPLSGGGQQTFQNVDVSSTGDPHIAEVGTAEDAGGTTHAVDVRWDSMTAHDDLVHSNQIAGGYRVSTAVTAADANGVTSNQSASVRTNFGQDGVTMNRDGSYAVYDNGSDVALGKGESATLSGGETVAANQDGSLTVSASDGRGGTIATTLRSTGSGVDVTTHAHEIALGGDAVTHRTPHHGGHPRRPVPPLPGAAAPN